MKTYKLSTAGERITGIVFSAVMIVCMGLLLYALRSDLVLMLVTALAELLLCAGLIFYVLSVTKASVTADPEGKKLHVRAFPSDYTVDLSEAVLLQTLPRKSGHTAVRVLVFTNAEEKVIATVPTFFTFRQGVMAEPMAIQLAEALNLPFRQNVMPWEYDEEKRREHEKEVAQQQKQESKARSQAKIHYLRKKLLSRADVNSVKPAAAEEEPRSTGDKVEESEGQTVNYDAADDEK